MNEKLQANEYYRKCRKIIDSLKSHLSRLVDKNDGAINRENEKHRLHKEWIADKNYCQKKITILSSQKFSASKTAQNKVIMVESES